MNFRRHQKRLKLKRKERRISSNHYCVDKAYLKMIAASLKEWNSAYDEETYAHLQQE